MTSGALTTIERVHTVLNMNVHIWGWEVALHLFLAGLAGGLTAFAAYSRLSPTVADVRSAQIAAVLALPLILADILLLWIDLGSKWTPFWLYVRFRPTSAMWWGSWILLATFAVAALLWASTGLLHRATGPFGPMLRSLAGWVKNRERGLAIAGTSLGLALAAYGGVLLGTLELARPAWRTSSLTLLFLASAASSSLALATAWDPSESPARRWLTRILVLQLLLLGLYLVDLHSAGGESRAAAAVLLRGPLASPFWGLGVLGGAVLPLLTLWLPSRRACGTPAATAALVLLGALTIRMLVLYAGHAAV